MGNIPPSLIRQPPPPPPRRSALSDDSRRHSGMDSDLNDEGNTLMIEGKSVSTNHNMRLRPYYFRSCKRKMLTNIGSLPSEVLFEILIRLPAQDIYDLVRLVCRMWYHMIHTQSFIDAHLHHTTGGLLLQMIQQSKEAVFIYVRNGQIVASEYGYPFVCPVWTSCNGLVLGASHNNNSLYILNPATKQHFALPSFNTYCSRYNYSGIAYAADSMEFKVVITRHSFKDPFTCKILTVGVDNSWRQLCTEHLSPEAKERLNGIPLITDGYMHWINMSWMLDIVVVTLDIETEIFTETPPPFPYDLGCKIRLYYMTTGRYLSMLVTDRKPFWEIWVMEPEPGEWRKLHDIDAKAQMCTYVELLSTGKGFLTHVGWLEYPELLLFCLQIVRTPSYYVYNLHKRAFDSIQIPFGNRLTFSLTFHKPSLVFLRGS